MFCLGHTKNKFVSWLSLEEDYLYNFKSLLELELLLADRLLLSELGLDKTMPIVNLWSIYLPYQVKGIAFCVEDWTLNKGFTQLLLLNQIISKSSTK